MEEQLEQYLQELIETLKEGGQFAMEQLPLFIQEYLDYYAMYHGFWATVLLLTMTLIGVLWYKGCGTTDWDEDLVFPLSIVALLPFIPVMFFFFMNVLNFLKVVIAPRLYLIENLTSLIN